MGEGGGYGGHQWSLPHPAHPQCFRKCLAVGEVRSSVHSPAFVPGVNSHHNLPEDVLGKTDSSAVGELAVPIDEMGSVPAPLSGGS